MMIMQRGRMLGLSQILTESGLTIDQQKQLLNLLKLFGYLTPTNLMSSLTAAQFNETEINFIIICVAKSMMLDSQQFCPEQLLQQLSNSNTDITIVKTKAWFTQLLKRLFLDERLHSQLVSRISPACLNAFMPQVPLPRESHYDHIIILDSQDQMLTPGLEYLKQLETQNKVTYYKVHIPSIETYFHPYRHDQFAFTQLLQKVSLITSFGLKLTRSPDLSHENLEDFLTSLLIEKTSTIQPVNLYQGLSAAAITNRILIIAAKNDAEKIKSIAQQVYQAVNEKYPQAEVVYYLSKNEFTNEDFIKQIIERFQLSQPAIQLSPTPVPSASNMPVLPSAAVRAAIRPEPAHFNWTGTAITGLLTFGFLAAANPERTQSTVDIISRFVQETARRLLSQ